MPVPHHTSPPIGGALVAMALEQSRDFGLDGLRQQRAGAVAQNLRQRIGKTSWLAKWENVSLGHGVSLLRWRSGGVKHPHDTPPHPFTPSPNFAHSSSRTRPSACTRPDVRLLRIVFHCYFHCFPLFLPWRCFCCSRNAVPCVLVAFST